jgi:hypothetical protein
MSPWVWLAGGYLLSVLIETPALWIGLSPVHSRGRKLFAGLWLTACTYPVVALIMPKLPPPYYPWAAEAFAPISECALFATAFRDARGRTLLRDCAAIVVANLASFAAGWWLFW